MNSRFLVCLRLLGGLALAVVGHSASVSAAEPAPAATVQEYTDEQKALLKALDSELGRFEALIAKVDDAKYAEFLKEQLAGLVKRRDAFKQVAFDGGKYDEIRYDLNVDIQRVAQWMEPSISPLLPKK